MPLNFNPRSREGSDTASASSNGSCTDFNPRSREGSDPSNNTVPYPSEISIHAPVKGATAIARLVWVRLVISIHAPVKGATHGRIAYDNLRLISIHAPVKGATDTDVCQQRHTGISIHAPVKGATIGKRFKTDVISYFNPRSREGSDCPRSKCPAATGDFNPRSREGSDTRAPSSLACLGISIHAPVKGATAQ